jgi:hypothetical protein
MNGVELVAGSNPTRRSKRGSIDPTTQPMTTMLTKVAPTKIAKRGPSPHIVTRAIPTLARISPRTNP